MSDYCIPFEIEMEIIEKVSDGKSLIRLWSLIKPATRDDTQPRSCSFLIYKENNCADEVKYICFDDNHETLFNVQQQESGPSLVSPRIKQYSIKKVVGACHGFMCFSGFHQSYKKRMLVIWNPSIPRSFGILVPNDIHYPVFGFGVRPDTKDPTVVKLTSSYDDKFWKAQVFTLSSSVWKVISGNLPGKSILFNESTHVVIDRLIYWGAYEMTFFGAGGYTPNHMLVSFDLITKEFRVLDLPDSLTNELYGTCFVSVCKLRESLVVYGDIMVEQALCCGVWVMEHDSSFRKLFTIGADTVGKMLGFKKSGEAIFEAWKDYRELTTTLDVYDPSSQQIKNLGIVGAKGSFFMGSYKEPVL